MIKETIDLLQLSNWYGISKNIEIAKGKYEKIYTLKEGVEKAKRIWQLRKL